jgi:hypothetical protein
MKRFSPPQVVGGLLTIVVIAAVAIGMLLLGSPAEERVRRFDERRVQDLASITRAVDLYWTRHARLPSSFDELQGEPAGNVGLNDPSTNEPYEYRSLEADLRALCAVRAWFATLRSGDSRRLLVARDRSAVLST